MAIKQGVEKEDSKGRIVIVDDSGMSRKMLRNILEEAGYSVVGEAADGMEGVLAYKQYSPDVITLDITMPNMSGTEALKEIKDYDSDAKAIMITAAGQQNKVIEALKLGAQKFITKPFDKEEIIKNIDELMK
ncbi:MAG: response regulator [Lachnospira sp.]|nr:response regulator [Lachnospira sp.]